MVFIQKKKHSGVTNDLKDNIQFLRYKHLFLLMILDHFLLVNRNFTSNAN